MERMHDAGRTDPICTLTNLGNCDPCQTGGRKKKEVLSREINVQLKRCAAVSLKTLGTYELDVIWALSGAWSTCCPKWWVTQVLSHYTKQSQQFDYCVFSVWRLIYQCPELGTGLWGGRFKEYGWLQTFCSPVHWELLCSNCCYQFATFCIYQHLESVANSMETWQCVIVDDMFFCHRIHSVFKICRPVEDVNFRSNIGNVNLFCHASPVHNFVGILSRLVTSAICPPPFFIVCELLSS